MKIKIGKPTIAWAMIGLVLAFLSLTFGGDVGYIVGGLILLVSAIEWVGYWMLREWYQKQQDRLDKECGE